jgi:hypothetical protein
MEGLKPFFAPPHFYSILFLPISTRPHKLRFWNFLTPPL